MTMFPVNSRRLVQVLLWIITTAGFWAVSMCCSSCQGRIIGLIFFPMSTERYMGGLSAHSRNQWSYFPRKWCPSVYMWQCTQSCWCTFFCLIGSWFHEITSFLICFKDINYSRKWMIVNDDQQEATILAYLCIPNQLYMFQAMSSPIIRCCKYGQVLLMMGEDIARNM